jgi:hypothetical protein
MSCPLQTATRPHCSEFVVWGWNINVSKEKTHAIYIPRRHKVPDEVLQLNGREYLRRGDDMETPYREDPNEGHTHVRKGLLSIQMLSFKYKYYIYALQSCDSVSYNLSLMPLPPGSMRRTLTS